MLREVDNAIDPVDIHHSPVWRNGDAANAHLHRAMHWNIHARNEMHTPRPIAVAFQSHNANFQHPLTFHPHTTDVSRQTQIDYCQSHSRVAVFIMEH